MKVLSIDDDHIAIRVVSAFIAKYASEHGFDIAVKGITDPVQGMLELTTQGDAYDLILLDVQMPRLSGLEIFNVIKKRYSHLKGRIVFVTASAEELDVSFLGGAFRVVNKPVNYLELKDSVDAILDKHMASS